MAKPKVFVVQPIMDAGREALEEFAEVEVHESERMITRADLIEGVRDADYVWMLGDTPIDADVMDAAPDLKGIATRPPSGSRALNLRWAGRGRSIWRKPTSASARSRR